MAVLFEAKGEGNALGDPLKNGPDTRIEKDSPSHSRSAKEVVKEENRPAGQRAKQGERHLLEELPELVADASEGLLEEVIQRADASESTIAEPREHAHVAKSNVVEPEQHVHASESGESETREDDTQEAEGGDRGNR